MLNSRSFSKTGRNVILYAIGVGLATVGALGLAEAISIPFVIAVGSFVVGLLVVVFVHERLDGPL